MSSSFSRHPDLILGELPVDKINQALGTELEAGNLVLSRAAQIHALKRHPNDYPLFMPHIAAICANPLYAGDDLKNSGKIELIGTARGLTGFVLVAITVERDKRGQYHVVSFYPVSREKIENRRQKGFLSIVT